LAVELPTELQTVVLVQMAVALVELERIQLLGLLQRIRLQQTVFLIQLLVQQSLMQQAAVVANRGVPRLLALMVVQTEAMVVVVQLEIQPAQQTALAVQELSLSNMLIHLQQQLQLQAHLPTQFQVVFAFIHSMLQEVWCSKWRILQS
jgi:hypothetical protein